jgi:hypothetical protein
MVEGTGATGAVGINVSGDAILSIALLRSRVSLYSRGGVKVQPRAASKKAIKWCGPRLLCGEDSIGAAQGRVPLQLGGVLPLGNRSSFKVIPRGSLKRP